MLKIITPNDHVQERKYIIETLFSDFLGISILELEHTASASKTEIRITSNKKLIFEDHFFHKSKHSGYLQEASIPTDISYFHRHYMPFLTEEDLPILYGHPFLEITETEITCGADIFASAFFMLTRWEEYVLPQRDIHGRFPYSASLACKFSFHHRPIVNEYIEFIWALLTRLGYNGPRKQWEFEAVVTHDVDIPLFWKNPTEIVKKIGGDLIKRKNITSLQFTCKSFFETFIKGEKDPYDTFDFLMDVSEKHNIKSRFYFLVNGNTKYDKGLELSNSFIQHQLNKIYERGHEIGFHPSYGTIESSELWHEEKKNLEESCTRKIVEGRQHFLRFQIPFTWQVWETENMEFDSSLGYPEQPGFRCGVCYPYNPFNFLSNQKLKIKEMPLLLMEGSFVTYMHLTPNKMLESSLNLINTVKKYRGTFVLLWHNSSFSTPEWQPYSSIYPILIEKLS